MCVLNPIPVPCSVCRVLGHAGQPLHDLQRHMAVTNSHDEVEGKAASGASGRLQGLEHTLQWGHLCPTSPDTLPCYPYVDHDPFFISTTHNDRPHIYFAGNQVHCVRCIMGNLVIVCCMVVCKWICISMYHRPDKLNWFSNQWSHVGFYRCVCVL